VWLIGPMVCLSCCVVNAVYRGFSAASCAAKNKHGAFVVGLHRHRRGICSAPIMDKQTQVRHSVQKKVHGLKSVLYLLLDIKSCLRFQTYAQQLRELLDWRN